MPELYAQPYDITANGFYFSSTEEFETKQKTAKNDYGEPVEEFEIQFIDGEEIDSALAHAIGLDQGNFPAFFTACEEWDEEGKIIVALAVGECGYQFDSDSTTPSDFELDIYYLDTLKDLAEEFVYEGYFGEIPERLHIYIDLEAIARDLAVEYTETVIAGKRFVYSCR